MKNLKFESIDLFKASIIETDKITGGYPGNCGSATQHYEATITPSGGHTDTCGDWDVD